MSLLLFLIFTSCKEELEEQTFTPERLFMPTGAVKSTGAVTAVKLSWKEALYVDTTKTSYTIEVATDTLFQSKVVYTTTSETASVTITDEHLNVRQRYYARVKTNATDKSAESKWVVSSRFAIPGEQIFTAIRTIDRAAAINWKATEGVTKLIITRAGGDQLVEIPLTAADVAANSKTVENLLPNTAYAVEIFAGTKSKGYQSFRTNAPLAGDLIDLRGVTNKATLLADTIPDIPNGSIIILKRGVTYTVNSSISIGKSLTFISGADLNEPSQATIFFTNNFNFEAGSVINKIEFKDVTMRSDNYASRYIFNTTNGATVSNFIIENCRAGIFRGLVRLNATTPTTIENFTITNSVLDSLAGYGVLTVDNAACKVNSIIIKNSTIYKAEKILTSKSNTANITLDNLTINEAVLGNNYFIDYNGVAVTNPVKITNTIFGIGKSSGGNRAVRGYRGTITFDVSNSYTTSDFALAAINPNPLPNTTAYDKTSFDLFQKPKEGDFTIKDAAFAGKATAGDLRWRK